MPFPVDEKYILEAESRLGIRLPAIYRQRLIVLNGGEVSVAGDDWVLFPVLDSSSPKRVKRTCNDVVLETKQARSWTGFPSAAVAIGTNGGGDRLVLLPDNEGDNQLSSTLYWWDHETGAIHVASGDFETLLGTF